MEAYLIKTMLLITFQTNCALLIFIKIPKYFSDLSVKLHVSGIVRVKSSLHKFKLLSVWFFLVDN